MSVITKLKILFLGLVLCQACVDPIDLEIDREFSDSIVVEGRVVKAEPYSFVEVEIYRLFDFSVDSRQPINLQEVILYDDQGGQMELDRRTRSLYRNVLDESSSIQAEPGRSYKISFRTTDGRVVESSFDEMLPNTHIGEVSYSEVESVFSDAFGNFSMQPALELSMDIKWQEDLKGGLYWDMNSTYKVSNQGFMFMDGALVGPKDLWSCYLSERTAAEDLFVFDAISSSKTDIDEYPLVQIRKSSKFAQGYYVEIEQYSLSSGALEYWKSKDLLIGRRGNVFDIPVGELPSNLRMIDEEDRKIFGYFFATEEKAIVTRIPEVYAEQEARVCPRPEEEVCTKRVWNGFIFADVCICEPCCDCRKLEYATLTPPDFWEEE